MRQRVALAAAGGAGGGGLSGRPQKFVCGTPAPRRLGTNSNKLYIQFLGGGGGERLIEDLKRHTQLAAA